MIDWTKPIRYASPYNHSMFELRVLGFINNDSSVVIVQKTRSNDLEVIITLDKEYKNEGIINQKGSWWVALVMPHNVTEGTPATIVRKTEEELAYLISPDEGRRVIAIQEIIEGEGLQDGQST